MSRTASALVGLHLVLAGLVVGALAGWATGADVSERRTVNCTLWCQRVAGDEYGLVESDGYCTCYGDVRALVRELDHAQDTEWPTRGDR